MGAGTVLAAAVIALTVCVVASLALGPAAAAAHLVGAGVHVVLLARLGWQKDTLEPGDHVTSIGGRAKSGATTMQVANSSRTPSEKTKSLSIASGSKRHSNGARCCRRPPATRFRNGRQIPNSVIANTASTINGHVINRGDSWAWPWAS